MRCYIVPMLETTPLNNVRFINFFFLLLVMPFLLLILFFLLFFFFLLYLLFKSFVILFLPTFLFFPFLFIFYHILLFVMDPNRNFMLQYTAILAFLYLVELILFGLTFNMWLTFDVSIEESMDYHISNYKANPRDIDYIQEEVSSLI
jgi:hypothetical protein